MIIRAIPALLCVLISISQAFSSSFPYYYEVSKEGKRCHILGAHYALSFGSLPQDVQASVLDHSSLLTESSPCFLDRGTLVDIGWLKQPDDQRNYFSELPCHYKEQLSRHRSLYQFYQLQPDELTPVGLYMFYQGALSANGMSAAYSASFRQAGFAGHTIRISNC